MSNIELRLGVILIVVALGILALLGAQSSHQPSHPQVPPKPQPTGWHGLPDYTTDADGTETEIKKLALRTRGDYSKLTDDERRWIEGMTANHGEMTLRHMATYFLAKEQKKAAGKKRTPARLQNAKTPAKASPSKPQKRDASSGAKHSRPDPSRPALPAKDK